MANTASIDLLSRLLGERALFNEETARTVLQIAYSPEDHARMADLAEKSNEGLLTDAEREELESYILVGDLVSLLQSKARQTLAKHSPAA